MSRSKTLSFITEIPLRVAPGDERAMRKRLEAARQVYNACLGESLKRLELLRQSKLYQVAGKLPKGPHGSPQAKERATAFREADVALGFREYDLHAYATQFNHCWIGDHLDANTIQTVASRAFGAVKEHALGKRGKPRFKGEDQFDSVEGKTNKQGIRWRDDRVEWLGLTLPAIIDANDPVIAHGLNSPIKYVRLVRRNIKGRNRFYVQLVNEGFPYQKPKNKLGQGDVGLDIGPSTIAVVSEDVAFLTRFCDELERLQGEIRRLQRKVDRQRRANNPENYNPDGTIKAGPKRWRKSNRQKQTEAKLAELCRREAAYRKSLHGALLNIILRMGDHFNLEKLSYRAFQRAYGKSVSVRAPGMFVERLRRKSESAGGVTNEFPTSLRLSQLCHGCGTVDKKSLSERWHHCDCGVAAQRDLYSAFLAVCVEGDRLDIAKAEELWPRVEPLLVQAMSSLEQQLASGREFPASFGFSRRQSQSPANQRECS
ncbi:MAG: transposase [Chloroflexi bacterium]|nr:transposase [Chloroflexota bacterium]